MLNFKKYLFSTFLTVAFSISIFAQEVEEVVVTATKKEESTQDIAISVEALQLICLQMSKYMICQT